MGGHRLGYMLPGYFEGIVEVGVFELPYKLIHDGLLLLPLPFRCPAIDPPLL